MKNRFHQFFGVPEDRIYLFAKGRVGLYAVLKAIGVGKGDEVVVSGYTCFIVPSAPIFLGAKCRYVDINPQTYNVNPEAVIGAITGDTKAIILQHTYGIPLDPSQILEAANAKGIPIIEDCCLAFGSMWNGKLCGTFGKAAFFSGQWNKPFSSGLGGILMVNDESFKVPVEAVYRSAVENGKLENLIKAGQILAHRFLVGRRSRGLITVLYRRLSSWGLAVGSSSNAEFVGKQPEDYLKRMARSQQREGARNLAKIKSNIAHRKRIAAYYNKALLEAGFAPLENQSGAENVLVRYPVRVRNKGEVLAAALKRRFEIGSWFEIPLHPKGIDMESFGYRAGMCPQSERACTQVINLPTHPKISIAHAEKTIAFLREYGKPV